MSEKLTMGIDIDRAIIEANVTNLISSAIAAALGDKEKLATSVVKNVIASYVKKDGTPCKKDTWDAMPYLQYLAERCIEDVMREQVTAAVTENREAFEDAIKKELSSAAFKKNMAARFIDSVLGCAASSWKMPVTISFEQPKD